MGRWCTPEISKYWQQGILISLAESSKVEQNLAPANLVVSLLELTLSDVEASQQTLYITTALASFSIAFHSFMPIVLFFFRKSLTVSTI